MHIFVRLRRLILLLATALLRRKTLTSEALWKSGDKMRKTKGTGRTGRPSTCNTPVRVTDLETNESIVYPNYRAAAIAINGNRGVVYLCLEGVRQSHRGYALAYCRDE